jgi:hypothetical protein
MMGEPEEDVTPTSGVYGRVRWRLAEPGEVFVGADGSEWTDTDFEAAIDRYLAIPVDELVEQIVTRGRPMMGSEPARVVPVRLEPRLVASVDERAAAEGCNRSELIRRALRAYLT